MTKKIDRWIKRTYFRKSTNCYDVEMKVCPKCFAEFSYDAETGIGEYNYCPNCGSRNLVEYRKKLETYKKAFDLAFNELVDDKVFCPYDKCMNLSSLSCKKCYRDFLLQKAREQDSDTE